MWFKQVQLFQLTDSSAYSVEQFSEKLSALLFTPCLPSWPSSIGWISVVDEEGAPLCRAFNGYMMFCLQMEEKILPSSVIRQALSDKVKQIELTQSRKVWSKEKLALKDEITMTLLPRAFSKLSRIYAYIDTKNQWLVLGTNNLKKTEQFMSLFKKSISEQVHPFELKKLAPLMTSWLKEQSYPDSFSIEKACVLQDPNQQNRIIRCQYQDLFATGIQSLIKEGCQAKQLALLWQDRLHFSLSDTFMLHGIKFHEELLSESSDLEIETKQQQFDADFLIMTETFSLFLKELLDLLLDQTVQKKTEKIA